MGDSTEHKTEGRRRILVNHVVRADGSRSCELKVYCSGRDTAVPLEVCRACPRCHGLELGERDGQGWVTCTPPGLDPFEALGESSTGDALSEGAVVVEEEVLVRDLVSLFVERRLRLVVVVDPEGRVSGVVHDSHLAPQIQAHARTERPPAAVRLGWSMIVDSTASAIMSSVRPIGDGVPVREALSQMASTRHQRLVVVDGAGTPVGVLTDVHALRALTAHR